MEGLIAATATPSIFIKCNSEGECVETKPQKASNYLNKAVKDGNVVSFEKGKKKSATTSEKHCVVEDGKCSIEEGDLVSGDMCVANESIYLVKDEGVCVKAEKYVERLQFVNDKIYRLMEDSVVQIFDGYYFVNGDNRVIGSVEEYAKADTVCYMCSVKGFCFAIEPDDGRYYKDYATEKDGKFKVITFFSDKKSKRDEGSSGYEAITEAGIYRLDDGSYAQCEVGINDEVVCEDIQKTGSQLTRDGEVIVCSKKDKKIECTQAVKGGYYYIDGVLLECDANEEGEALECKEIKKEGYFLADNANVLYKCDKKEEENVESSSFGLLGVNDINEEDITGYEVEEEETVVEEFRRENGEAEGNEEGTEEIENNDEGENNGENVEPENGPVEEIETPTEV